MLRSAIIGGGLNSAVGRAHASAIRMDGRSKIVCGFFSRDSRINEETARALMLPSEGLMSSEDEVLGAAASFDLLHILTPPENHLSLITKALKSGIPVISEKPLVTSVSEAEALAKIVKNEKGFLRVIFNYLGYPMVREMKAWISSGHIGDVHEVRGYMPQESFIKLDDSEAPVVPQPWRLKDGALPTVSLDLGVHVHMLMKYLLSEEPVSVFGLERRNGNFPGVKDSMNALVNYESGAIGNLWFGKSYLGFRNGLGVNVFGSKGSLVWDQMNPETVRFTDARGQVKIIDRASPGVLVASGREYERFKVGHPSGFIEALANYYSDIYRDYEAYASEEPLAFAHAFGVEESLSGLRLLAALSLSSESGRVEQIP